MVRTHESTRKLARHIEHDTARIRSATVSLRGGRWFVSFTMEISCHDRSPARPESIVGVDLGVKSLAVLSTGRLSLTRPTFRSLCGSCVGCSGRPPGVSARTSAQSRCPRRAGARANPALRSSMPRPPTRGGGLHKLTTRLVRTHGTIVLEDLNIVGMMSNRKLARRIADAGMGELRRQVEYKAAWVGACAHLANRWYPSSKTCSGCGAVKAKLRLSERIFRCDQCGHALDRDLNAARNLTALVETSSPSCGATVNEPAGNPRKPRTVRAAGIATGRPVPDGAGQRRRRKSPTQDTHIFACP